MSVPKTEPKPHITPMPREEFEGALRKLKFSKNGFSRFIERERTTISRWASGTNPVPAEIALCLRLMVRFKIVAPADCQP